jgi:hypothetical protein
MAHGGSLLGPSDQKSTLPEVVQDQGREHQADPRQPNRTSSEVSHVRIECLRSRNYEKDGAQDHKPVHLVHQKEFEAVPGENGNQHLRIAKDLEKPQQGENAEPHEEYRPEEAAHPGRPTVLQEKEARKDGDGHGNHVGPEQGGDDPDSLNGAKHRDGRSDHAVPIEQTGPKEPERHQGASGTSRSCIFGHRKGCQGQDAALTMIVRPEDEGEILEGHDHEQGPEHERENAQHVPLRHSDPVFPMETLTNRIERARTDVTEHHAESRK